MKQFKKLLAVLVVGAMALSVGCGNKDVAETPAATTETPVETEAVEIETPAETEAAEAPVADGETTTASINGADVTVALPEGWTGSDTTMAGALTLTAPDGLATIIVMGQSIPGVDAMDAKTYAEQTGAQIEAQAAEGQTLSDSGVQTTAVGDLPYFVMDVESSGMTMQQIQYHIIKEGKIYIVAAQNTDGSAIDGLKDTAIKVAESLSE